MGPEVVDIKVDSLKSSWGSLLYARKARNDIIEWNARRGIRGSKLYERSPTL